MRKILSTLILIMAFSLPAQAGVTFFGMKAETWNKLDKADKFLYVQGLFDGLVFSKFKIHGVRISTEISIDQYIHAIDDIYSDYRNSLIPAPFVLKIVTLEVDGLQKDKMESEILNYRKRFSNLE
ncbi:MAG: hypothetical protein BMS9Abin02_1865 [Anaerolineae bacterium]|nr:MAG: hypothetical protein BMS9Abin02_1865 [Anaerolineae bacterium]